MSPRGGAHPQLGPIEQAARGMAATIGNVLDDYATAHPGLPRIGFAVFLYTFGDKGWMTYVANGDRESMIEAVLEFVGRQGKVDAVQAIEERIVREYGRGDAQRHGIRRELHRLKGALKLGRDEQIKALRLAYIECDSAGFEKRAREILGIAP